MAASPQKSEGKLLPPPCLTLRKCVLAVSRAGRVSHSGCLKKSECGFHCSHSPRTATRSPARALLPELRGAVGRTIQDCAPTNPVPALAVQRSSSVPLRGEARTQRSSLALRLAELRANIWESWPLTAFAFLDICVQSLMQLLRGGAGEDFFSDCCLN